MTSERFQSCMGFIRRWEGGYVNHPNDRGGATNKGVTQRVYDQWRLRHGKPRLSVRAIEDHEVDAIYLRDYWNAARCPEIREPLDLITFDMAVNSGPGRAIRFLQRAVGVKADGVFGPITRAAVGGSGSEAVERFLDAREAFDRRIGVGSQSVFLNGWLNRLNALRSEVGCSQA